MTVLHVTNLSKINCGAAISLINGITIVGVSVQQKAYITTDGEISDKIGKIIGKENVITAIGDSYRKENHIRGYGTIIDIFALRKAIKKYKPDVIHLNSLESFFPLGWTSVLSGIPAVGHQRETYKHKWNSFGLRFMKKIISISNYVEETLPLHLKRKSVTIYNPVDLRPEDEITKIGNRNKILYLGRVSKEKGPELLFDAFIKIHNSNDANLVIAGFDSSSDEALYADSIKKKWETLPEKLKERIELIGWTNNIEELLQEACLLVVPSRVKEGLGRSALEAMSYGVPVVASKNGGLTEVVEPNVTGYLFEPGNLNDLANKMQLILKDKKLLKKMSKQSKLRISKIFNDQLYKKNIIKVYESII